MIATGSSRPLLAASFLVSATDPDGDAVTYSISGGADAEHFDLNASTGVLIFRDAPDYENPTDDNFDNTYLVEVNASDGTLVTIQAITATVTYESFFEGTGTKVRAPDAAAEDYFSTSLSLSGNLLAVGAYGADPDGIQAAGAVYLYRAESNGSTSYLSKVTAPDAAQADSFGISLSLSGDLLAVGAHGVDLNGLQDAGATYLYRVDNNGNATLLTKLIAPNAAQFDYFGYSVSQSGKTSQPH